MLKMSFSEKYLQPPLWKKLIALCLKLNDGVFVQWADTEKQRVGEKPKITIRL